MFQFPKGFCFNLADPFACDRKLLPDFLQRMVRVHADAETHAQDAFFAGRQAGQNRRARGTQIGLNRSVKRLNNVPVFDEITQMAVLFISGVSRLIGSLAIFRTLRTFSSGMDSFSASSSGVGSRPISCNI